MLYVYPSCFVFLLLSSETNVIVRVRSLIPYQEHRIFNHSSRPLIDYFKTKGIETDCYNDMQLVDVSGCLDKEVSNEASLLLDFFTLVKDFTKASLDPGIKEEVFSVIREMVASSSQSGHDNNVNLSSHAILVHRN